jgi:hypothetical protein
LKRAHLFFPSFLVLSGLVVCGGVAAAGCNGAEDSGLFGTPSGTSDGEDSGAVEEEDGSTAAGDGSTARDGGTTKKDGVGPTEDSGNPSSDGGPTVDAAVGRTIGCTLDAGNKCAVGNEVCCRSAGALLGCTGSGACTGITQLAIPCDDALDCNALGHPNELCCATIQSNGVKEVACRKPAECDVSNRRNLCDPNAADPCPIGGSCKLSTQTMPGFWLCF